MKDTLLTQQETLTCSVVTSTRAAIYARSATQCEQGSLYSLNAQMAACRSYCDERGYLLDEQYIYQEIASGADLRNRPSLHDLRMAARSNAFDIVVILDADRLSRNPAQVQALANELEAIGIQIASARENGLLAWDEFAFRKGNRFYTAPHANSTAQPY